MLAEWAASLVPRSASWTYWWQWFISEAYWDKIKTTWRLFLAFLDCKHHACLLLEPLFWVHTRLESLVRGNDPAPPAGLGWIAFRNILICLHDSEESIKCFREKSFLRNNRRLSLCCCTKTSKKNDFKDKQLSKFTTEDSKVKEKWENVFYSFNIPMNHSFNIVICVKQSEIKQQKKVKSRLSRSLNIT